MQIKMGHPVFGVRRLVAAFQFCGAAAFQVLPAPRLKAAPPQTKAVTSVERLAKAEGKAEGKREDLSSLLEAKFGRLAPDVVERIRQTNSVEKLSALLLQVLTIDSVEQLNW